MHVALAIRLARQRAGPSRFQAMTVRADWIALAAAVVALTTSIFELATTLINARAFSP